MKNMSQQDILGLVNR